MEILGLIVWSISGIWGTKLLVTDIFGGDSKVKFSPEQIGGLVFLPMGGLVTLFLAYLVTTEVISTKWDK